ACDDGEVCSGGSCGLSCGGDTPTLCGSSCVDIQTDRGHCGACDNACDDGEVCSGGSCGPSCGGGTSVCSDRCVDLSSSPAHCGSCGNACTGDDTAIPVCADGGCAFVCRADRQDCDR